MLPTRCINVMLIRHEPKRRLILANAALSAFLKSKIGTQSKIVRLSAAEVPNPKLLDELHQHTCDEIED